jgi:cation:H+ antiporter
LSGVNDRGKNSSELPEANAMFHVLVLFTLAAAVIIVAGSFLTKFADAIADLTGWGRLLVGSILLAGATSLPELAVDTNAILLGQPNLAAGDLLGSCLCNLLILATLDLSHFSRGRMLSPLASAHALSGMMTIVLCSLAVLAILTRPGIQLPGGLDLGSLAILAVYLGGSRLVYFDQRMAARPDTPGPDQAVLMPAHPRMGLATAVAGFIAAGAVILLAAPSLAHAADELAERSGLGRTFVGTTLVALSTSLPELVASLAALRLGAYDLAIGNVFGSNSFNIAMLAVLDAIQPGPLLSLIASVNAITGVAVILSTAVAVTGQLYRVESRVHFIEPDAFLLVALVLGAMGLVYYFS